MSLLFRSCFSLWKPNQKDHKLCAAATVEPPQEEELARLYHIPIPSQTDLPISYNIAPSQNVLTIRFNPETRARSLDALQWGLIPYWAKDPNIAYRTINARAETIDKAPSFRRLSLNGAA
jgi:putative SOS response-associated peptidase YedK